MHACAHVTQWTGRAHWWGRRRRKQGLKVSDYNCMQTWLPDCTTGLFYRQLLALVRSERRSRYHESQTTGPHGFVKPERYDKTVRTFPEPLLRTAAARNSIQARDVTWEPGIYAVAKLIRAESGRPRDFQVREYRLNMYTTGRRSSSAWWRINSSTSRSLGKYVLRVWRRAWIEVLMTTALPATECTGVVSAII